MSSQTYTITELLIDQILELQTQQQIRDRLLEISSTDPQLYHAVTSELMASICHNETEATITLSKLLILENIIRIKQEPIEHKVFKANTVFQMVAIARGYQGSGQGQQFKGPFVRNLKKQAPFWGVSNIQNIFQALVNKSAPTLAKSPPLEVREYLWGFMNSNLELLPAGFEIAQFMFKSLLMLRPDDKNQLKLFNKLQNLFLSDPYHVQAMRKNFRFGLQFLRNCYNEKQIKMHPQLSFIHLLKNYEKYQLDNMFSIASLGLGWGSIQVNNCLVNTIKLGLTEHNYRILSCFIAVFTSHQKFNELIQAFNSNIPKIFIFLKYPPLYEPSLKTLKEFMLGPWPVSSLFSTFTEKCIQFWQKVQGQKEKMPESFFILVQCVIEKYCDTTVTDELKRILQQGNVEIEKHHQERIKEERRKYDWKAFERKSLRKNGEAAEDSGPNYRGIANIGNSCYMNSFLQSLFMTKEFRRQILQLSTLNVESKVLAKLRQIHSNNPGLNFATLARHTVKPLAELQRFFALLFKSKRPVINPTQIKSISPLQFQNTYQHDSIEFGRFLIESIAKSELGNYFEGEQTIQIQCPYCHAKRQKKEEFLDLILSTGDSEGTSSGHETIEGIFKHTLQDEDMENLVCEECDNGRQQIKKKSDKEEKEDKEEMGEKGEKEDKAQKAEKETDRPHSVKRHWISRFPNYIILTLKRFQFDIKQNKNLKKQFKVQLQESFSLGEAQYFLYSFIVHRGSSANSGHYFTFARHTLCKEDKSWLCLNDSTVSRMEDFSKVIEFLSSNEDDTPYILFGVEEKHREYIQEKVEEALILRGPLQSFIDKDDMEYMKSLSNPKSIGNIDLSLLKFATGNFTRRDFDDGDEGPHGGFNGGNNPIM